MNSHLQTYSLVLLSLVLLMAACAPEPQTQAIVQPLPISSSVSVDDDMRIIATIETPGDYGMSFAAKSPTPVVGQPSPSECQRVFEAPLLSYDLEATLYWLTHSLTVKQRVHLINDADWPLEKLVFNVPANSDPGAFVIRSVMLDGSANLAAFQLDGTVLTVLLDTPLAYGCEVSVQIDYEMTLAPISQGYHWGRLGYLGYSERQVNLGMWFPMLAVMDSERGWITPETYDVGEQTTLRVADITALLRVVGGVGDLRVAGPGVVARPGEGQWRFGLNQARDLTISVSDAFRTLSTNT